tara:strand:- start:2430 stop:3122 length:693 start_codon:yes stop_codon:yes gene_type:complete
MATVFITGANRGLGLEFVKQYAQKGHNVIACSRNFSQATELSQLAALHTNIQLYELNVTDEDQISELTTVFKNQPIDVLIHNAGVGGFQCEALGDMDQKGWLEVLTVNTVSPMLITQALLANILASKAKTIIGLTSILASIDDNNSGGRYSYRASKAALNQIIKSLACELSDDGVKAAVIHPGWVKTEMGGADGKITPAQSITGMMKVIENLQTKHSGSFFVYDGTQLPW